MKENIFSWRKRTRVISLLDRRSVGDFVTQRDTGWVSIEYSLKLKIEDMNLEYFLDLLCSYDINEDDDELKTLSLSEWKLHILHYVINLKRTVEDLTSALKIFFSALSYFGATRTQHIFDFHNVQDTSLPRPTENIYDKSSVKSANTCVSSTFHKKTLVKTKTCFGKLLSSFRSFFLSFYCWHWRGSNVSQLSVKEWN